MWLPRPQQQKAPLYNLQMLSRWWPTSSNQTPHTKGSGAFNSTSWEPSSLNMRLWGKSTSDPNHNEAFVHMNMESRVHYLRIT